MKEGPREQKGAQNQEISMVCEISQPKIAPCENGHRLRNNFAAPWCLLRNRGLAAKMALRCEINFAAQHPPLRKFSQLRNHLLALVCHFAAQYPHFAAAKWLRNPQSVKSPIFAAKALFRRVFRNCETTLWHTSAISQPRTLISQLRNGCEILHALKSFSAHTLKPHPCWTHFEVLPEVHFIHTISRFKAWEVRSP